VNQYLVLKKVLMMQKLWTPQSIVTVICIVMISSTDLSQMLIIGWYGGSVVVYVFTPEAQLHCCDKVNVDATFVWDQLIDPTKYAIIHLIEEVAAVNVTMIS